MADPLPPYPAGATTGSYDKTPAVVPASGLVIHGPDIATIEILAQGIGSPGTLVNMRAAFTTNGSTPAINPTDPVTSVSLGQNSTIQLVPPRTIGLVARPYLLKCVVEAVDANIPANKFTAYFTLAFPTGQESVTAVIPLIFVDGHQIRVPIDTANPPTSSTVAGVTTTTVSYKGEVVLNDPDFLLIVIALVGTKNSLGSANIKFANSVSPAAAPAFPTPGAPFAGTEQVGAEFTIEALQTGFNLRGNLLQRTFYSKIHAEDTATPNNRVRASLELLLKSEKTVTGLDVYVRRNKDVFLLETLATQVEPEGTVRLIDITDTDTIEVLVQPTGTATTQVLLREEHVPATDTIPTFPDITTITTYNDQGLQKYSDVSYMKGTFDIDNRISILTPRTGIEYRALSPGKSEKFRAQVTSLVNVNNSVLRDFLIRAVEVAVVTDLNFFYINSRNPDSYLPIQAGTDINGTITGAGTSGNPFILPVDKPEQLQIFAPVVTVTPEGLAFVQTGFAYDTDPITELFPLTPQLWHRAYSSTMRPLVYPNPVPPPTQGQPAEKPRKPLKGAEIIVASGGTEVGGIGPNPGHSKNILLRAVATGVGASTNVVDKSIYIQVNDPSV